MQSMYSYYYYIALDSILLLYTQVKTELYRVLGFLFPFVEHNTVPEYSISYMRKGEEDARNPGYLDVDGN